MTTDITALLERRGRAIWNELTSKCVDGSLPFVKLDAEKPGFVVSTWDVTESGDEVKDLALGYFYAELLVALAKKSRGDFDPFQVIDEVLIAIARKGDPGPIERGFLSRIAMLAMAASLN